MYNSAKTVTAVLVILAILVVSSSAFAQIGFTAYGGGVIPTGEFSKIDLQRVPPKSGATNGHSIGAGLAFRFRINGYGDDRRGLHPLFMFTLGYSETQFGHDVPPVVYKPESGDQSQFDTPDSRIRFRGVRAGLRTVLWPHNPVSASVGLGYQRGKFNILDHSFNGPGPASVGQVASLPATVITESGNISGVSFQAGITTCADRPAVFFLDLVRQMVFTKDRRLDREFIWPDETGSDTIEFASNYQWWEIRGGILFFLMN